MSSTLRGLTGRILLLGALVAATAFAPRVSWADDIDADGVDSAADNCPGVFNPLQADCNADGVGDACNPLGAAGADTDQDGICDAADNCVAVANAGQLDCDGDGAGDLCEATAASRDDDRDGVCNGSDACPSEPGGCAMQAITVPWMPAAPSLPHPTYSGATHTLKGIARYGGTQFRWDFGDGTAPTAWTVIANPYNLGVNHVYTGAIGQIFFATLSVRDSANPAVVASAIYPVRIHDSGPLPAASPYSMDPARMDVRIDMAIDQGLWYLHTSMSRSTYGDGAPGYAQPYGNWSGTAAGICAALEAFHVHGSRPGANYAVDPYVETAQRGLNHVLASATTSSLSAQVHGRPDFNLNGIGIALGPDDMYSRGICGLALASSGAPSRQSLVGSGLVRGRTYRQIAQDMAEWFAFAQVDSGTYRGGWHYLANDATADVSTTQWPMYAIANAEELLGITTPPFVRSELPYFMSYTRHAALDNRNGGWGYQDPNTYVNHAKTAAGIFYHQFMGNSPSHPEVQAALGFLYRYWSLNNYDGGGAWNVGLGNSYAMYSIMKAMRSPQPDIPRVVEYDYLAGVQTGRGFDWYYTPPGQTQEGLATNLVRRQAANGSWSDTIGYNALSGAHATAWDIIILSQGVGAIPPLAGICNCDFTWDRDQSVTMDGSCSTHPDPNRRIASYEWDFDYDAATFDVDATGVLGTLAGGYPTYSVPVVALRVTDDNPAGSGGPRSAIATCGIMIKPPPHCPHPFAGGPYLAAHGVPFQLDASASSDPDGDALGFAWDLDGDGMFDDASGSAPWVTFDAIGTFAIAVMVTDLRAPDPQTGPCSRVAFTSVEVGNHAPVADPGGPYAARPGQVVTLDGTGSSDPDGDAISHAWDLDNDGVFTDSASAAPLFTLLANAPVGSAHQVCLRVTDALGRASDARCTTVTAVANTPPTCAQPQPGIVAECTGGTVTVKVDGSLSHDPDGDPLAFAWTTSFPGGRFADPRAAVTELSLEGQAGACSLGYVATLTVSDRQAQSTCERPIEVADTTPPAFVGRPADLTVECDGGTAAAVDAWLASATASEACTSAKLVNNYVGVAGGCGATGTATVTWTATDSCGNRERTSAALAIVDTTAPKVACPAAVILECVAPLTAVTLEAAANDDCFGALAASGPTGAAYPVGTTAVTFSASDGCGNLGECSSSVTVTDTTPPSIVCPPSLTVECNAPRAALGIDAGTASGEDQCGGVTVDSDAPADGTYLLGTTTTTHAATDESGNESTCASTVTVVDSTGPAVDCPANQTVECTGLGSAPAVFTARAADVCGAPSPPACLPASGSAFPLGDTAVTCIAADDAGNVGACTHIVTVRDTIEPRFVAGTLKPRTVVGNCTGAPVAFAPPEAWDLCTPVTVTCGAVPGNRFGVHRVGCVATDASGNAARTVLRVKVKRPKPRGGKACGRDLHRPGLGPVSWPRL